MIKMFVKKIFISTTVPCAGAAEHRQKEGNPMGRGWYKALEDLVWLTQLGLNLLLPLVLSPLAGFGVGFLIMWLIYWIFARVMRSKVNRIFRKMQLVSAAFMATSHGLNDAQKTMGIITLALFIFGEIDEVAVPLWVKLACAMAMAAGTAIGGWKIVKTMGHRIFKLEPVHGFAAETS